MSDTEWPNKRRAWDVGKLLDEIDRLRAEVERLTKRNADADAEVQRLLGVLDERTDAIARAVELLRRYNTWAGMRELEVGERGRLVHDVTCFLVEHGGR